MQPILNAILPPQHVQQKDFDENYYFRCANAVIAYHYNYLYGGLDSNQTAKTVISEMADNYRFYDGKQLGNEWQYIKEAIPGVGTPGVYTPGFQSSAIIDFHAGSIAQMIKKFDKIISARTIGKGIDNPQTAMQDALNFALTQPEIFETMQKAGVMFKGLPPNLKIQSQKDIELIMQTTARDQNEITAVNLALATMFKNTFRKVFRDCGFHTLIAGMCSVEVKINTDTPIVGWEVINPLLAIKDRRVDDETGDYDEFGGKLKWYPVEQAIQIYEFDNTEAEELRALAQNQNDWMAWNKQLGYQAFWIPGNTMMVSVGKVAWQSFKPIQYKGIDKPDDYGNYHIKEIDGRSKASYWRPCIRQASIIAGKFIKQYGERINHTINSPSGQPMLPFRTLMPNMRFGSNTPMQSRLKAIQTRIDFLQLKKQQAIAGDFGRVLWLDPSKYNGKDRFRIIAEMKAEGVAEMSSNDGLGEQRVPLQFIDGGMSPSVEMYDKWITDAKLEMSQITNTSDIMRGLQQDVIGKGVMEQTIAANTTGNMMLLDSFTDFITQLIQYSTDQCRMNIASMGRDEVELNLPVGYGQVAYIKTTPDECYAKMLCYLNVDDLTIEQKKAQLMQTVMMYAQNQLLTPDTIFAIEKASTYTEMMALAEAGYAKVMEQRNRELVAAAHKEEMLNKERTDAMRYQTDKAAESSAQVTDAKMMTEAMKQQPQEVQ